MIPKHRYSLLTLTVGLALWTLAPFGGCSCQNPYGPTSGPTPTPVPPEPAQVADFLKVNPGDSTATYSDNWGGQVSSSVDGFGVSGITLNFVAGGPLGETALEMVGAFGKSTSAQAPSCGPPVVQSTYPHCQVNFLLFSPFNSQAQSDVTTSVPGGATGFRFWARQLNVPPNASNNLKVELVLKALASYTAANTCNGSAAYAYHYYLAPLTTSWQLYKPTFAQFQLPTWASTTIGGVNYKQSGTASLNDPGARGGSASNDLYLYALQLSPWNPQSFPSNSSNQNFDFEVDQLEFY